MNPARTALLTAIAVFASSCGMDTQESIGVDGISSSAPLSFAWPPVAGESYPDLALKNHLGENVRLSDFRGQTILIEPIGMT